MLPWLYIQEGKKNVNIFIITFFLDITLNEVSHTTEAMEVDGRDGGEEIVKSTSPSQSKPFSLFLRRK